MAGACSRLCLNEKPARIWSIMLEKRGRGGGGEGRFRKAAQGWCGSLFSSSSSSCPIVHIIIIFIMLMIINRNSSSAIYFLNATCQCDSWKNAAAAELHELSISHQSNVISRASQSHICAESRIQFHSLTDSSCLLLLVQLSTLDFKPVDSQ